MRPRVADGRQLTVLGMVPLDVEVFCSQRTKQLLHIVSELRSLFISKTCLTEFGAISRTFTLPTPCEEVSSLGPADAGCLAPCGCLTLAEVPDPLLMPDTVGEVNIPILQKHILDHYTSSTFNMCSHQQLPTVTGPPLHFTL